MIERLADAEDMDELGVWMIQASGRDPSSADPGSVEVTSVVVEAPQQVRQVTVTWRVSGVLFYVRANFDRPAAEYIGFPSMHSTPTEKEKP